MSYDVVQFEDDGEICVLPTCWFLDGNVFLPPVCDKNLRIAIMRSIPPTDAWDEYPASRLVRAQTYDAAFEYAKKLSNDEEDCDTSPCRGVLRRRRPKPIRRYTPNPTDEESQNMEPHTPLSLLNSTSISPAAGSSSHAVIYPVIRATTSSASASGVLNLSQPCEKANQQPSFPDNTDCMDINTYIHCRMDNILKAFQAMEATVLARFDRLDKRVSALSNQLERYHRDVLIKVFNQSPTKGT
ncbi:unnamed protein product [Calicophoron daubneyi]|uniref:Uncharacterized protein n=1 Tax=Calicophoron daubneyi TaxID=300641 RepID=A0AAV2TB29_CALDB